MTSKDKQMKIEFEGKVRTVADWASHLGISKALIYKRLAKGYPTHAVLSTESRPLKLSDEEKKSRRQKVSQNWRSSNPGYAKEYRANNRERLRENERQYRQSNRLAQREYNRQYRNTRYRTDPAYRMRVIVRARIRMFLKGKSVGGSTKRLLGCSYEQARSHIESQWTEEMCWENHGIVWDIDHIMPLSKTLDGSEVSLLAACNYRNLRPYPLHDNRYIKGASVGDGVEEWFESLKSSISKEIADEDSAQN
jgi:hypothetical protein